MIKTEIENHGREYEVDTNYEVTPEMTDGLKKAQDKAAEQERETEARYSERGR